MKVFAIACVTLLAASCAFAAPSLQDNRVEGDNTLGRAARYLGACLESDDMATCLAVKGITALNRAARSNNIELASGVTFQRCVFMFSESGLTLSPDLDWDKTWISGQKFQVVASQT